MQKFLVVDDSPSWVRHHVFNIKYILGEENVEAKFGIEVVKTEFFNGSVRVETKELKSITDNEDEQNKLLTILRNNEITPIGVDDVLKELLQE